MTFKEQLKNDIDRLAVNEEFKNSLSEMLTQEAKKPKPSLYISAVKYGAIAAAVCLISFGAVKLGALNGILPTSGSSAAGDAQAIQDTAAELQIYNQYVAPADGAKENLSEYSDGSFETEAKAFDENVFEEAPMNNGEAVPEESLFAVEQSESEQASVTEAGASFSDGGEVIDYNAPEYGKEAIYAKTAAIYSADRPWYTLEKTAELIRENDSLITARVVLGEQLSDEEAESLPQVNSAHKGTYYRAYIDGAQAVVFFFGSAEAQELGNPVYAQGDEIYCALEERDGIYLIREYPLGDIYTISGEEYIYLRIQPYELTSAESLIPSAIQTVTTTADNAAVYYCAYRLEDFKAELEDLIA